MMAIPSIDMEATERNITRLRQQAGLTVRDLQEIFGFTTPQAIYKWQHGTAMPAIGECMKSGSDPARRSGKARRGGEAIRPVRKKRRIIPQVE